MKNFINGLNPNDRPPELVNEIKQSFESVLKMNGYWTWKGKETYNLFPYHEAVALKGYINLHKDQKNFYIMDYGAGACQFSLGLLEELEKLEIDSSIKIHIISMTGDSALMEYNKTLKEIAGKRLFFDYLKVKTSLGSYNVGTTEVKNYKLYYATSFPIEQIHESLNQIIGNNKLDMVVSNKTVQHLTDFGGDLNSLFNDLNKGGVIALDIPSYYFHDNTDFNHIIKTIIAQGNEVLITVGIRGRILIIRKTGDDLSIPFEYDEKLPIHKLDVKKIDSISKNFAGYVVKTPVDGDLLNENVTLGELVYHGSDKLYQFIKEAHSYTTDPLNRDFCMRFVNLFAPLEVQITIEDAIKSFRNDNDADKVHKVFNETLLLGKDLCVSKNFDLGEFASIFDKFREGNSYGIQNKKIDKKFYPCSSSTLIKILDETLSKESKFSAEEKISIGVALYNIGKYRLDLVEEIGISKFIEFSLNRQIPEFLKVTATEGKELDVLISAYKGAKDVQEYIEIEDNLIRLDEYFLNSLSKEIIIEIGRLGNNNDDSIWWNYNNELYSEKNREFLVKILSNHKYDINTIIQKVCLAQNQESLEKNLYQEFLPENSLQGSVQMVGDTVESP